MKVYQPITNIVKDDECDLVADSHSILARWRNHFCLLFKVRGINDFRQRKIHAAEPLAPEVSAFEVKMAIEKLKRRRWGL